MKTNAILLGLLALAGCGEGTATLEATSPLAGAWTTASLACKVTLRFDGALYSEQRACDLPDLTVGVALTTGWFELHREDVIEWHAENSTCPAYSPTNFGTGYRVAGDKLTLFGSGPPDMILMHAERGPDLGDWQFGCFDHLSAFTAGPLAPITSP